MREGLYQEKALREELYKRQRQLEKGPYKRQEQLELIQGPGYN
ncbi:MAG: hypothetical protein ACOYBV_02410 [Candidatus Avilachnospira sp.]|jgi:hypothetical protein